jgi:hypothetical protein
VDPGKILGIVGLIAYLVVGWVPYLVSGLVVPGLALFLLWAVWIAGLVWAWRTFRKRPVWTLAFAPAAVAFWFLYVTIGEQVFGWTP